MFHTFTEGNGPLLSTAIHDGHELREDTARLMVLDEATRLREEDPYTRMLVANEGSRLVVHRSRFEVDVNRPRERAVYRTPADAWGLEIWKQPLSESHVADSLRLYDSFYAEVHGICSRLKEEFGHFVVLDIHSYNHRRDGPDGPPADPESNPEVNIGTGNMDRRKWARLVDRFLGDLRQFDYLGRKLDVRENVKFRGGHFSRWVHSTFPDRGCALAIEFKKFFMDEWTGVADERQLNALRAALRSAVPGLLEELGALDRGV